MPSAVLLNNLITGSTAITSSTEDSDFPLENLFDRDLGKPFKFTLTTGGWIEFDFGSAVDLDSVAILNHNFDSTVTVTITAGNTPNPGSTVGTPSYRARGIWSDVGTQNVRYVRITIVDSNSVQTGIGQIVIQERLELPRAHRYGKTPGRERADIFHETIRLKSYVYALGYRNVRDYVWRVLETELANFDTWDDAVEGRLYPAVFIVDTSGTEVLYVRKQRDYRPNELTDPMDVSGYDYRIELREESHGVELES